MDSVKGYVEHITYRNEENGYTVLSLSDPDREKAGEDSVFTAVGSLPEVGEGELLSLSGFWTTHSTYGEQFKIDSFEILPPTDAAAMERYLASGQIKGIKKALAHRIVKAFGDDTFTILDQEPERLAEIKGISLKKAREIAQQVFEKRDMRDALLFLTGFNIPNSLSMRIWQTYGPDIYRIIKDNPYKLADEVEGVGFKTADEIARKAGFAVDSRFRISSALLYTLELASAEGSMYLPRDILVRRTAALLGFGGLQNPYYAQQQNLYADEDPESYYAFEDVEYAAPVLLPEALRGADNPVEAALLDLSVDKKIILKKEEDEERVYTTQAYFTELRVARMLKELNLPTGADTEQVRSIAMEAAARSGNELDEIQMQAVLEAMGHTLMILTGGPGTGKTTTINTMIAVFERMGMSIELAAPTGRAAKRMKEATGREARTIHRLLEVSGDPDSGIYFNRDADEPLEKDVIIIDEMSMVDIYLFQSLLRAVVPGTHLIMVGDASQLPSVGPGSVLKDMIESGRILTVTLERIFRQAQQSDIVVNAHKINAGEHPVVDNKSPDFFFIRQSDPGTIIGTAVKLVGDNLPRYLKVDSSEIQVMAPMKKGVLGITNLNRVMQTYLNPADPGKEEHARGEMLFREGDRVMQIRNNYQIPWTVRGRHGAVLDNGEGVFNGDMGIIRQISRFSETVTVEFDEHRYVEYEFGDLDQLELAYAVTIHKAQGSEYPAVVIPLLRGPRMLMNRNLLYTAVTRAKSLVVLIGEPAVMNEMIDNAQEAKRYTTLSLRIKETDNGSDSQAGSLSDETSQQKGETGQQQADFSDDFDPDDPFAGWDDME